MDLRCSPLPLLALLVVVTSQTSAADKVFQTTTDDDTAQLLPRPELLQGLSQLSSTELVVPPASGQGASDGARIGLSEVGKLSGDDVAGQANSSLTFLLASEGMAQGKGKGKGKSKKAKGGKGRNKQKKAVFGRKGNSQDGKLSVLESLAAAKQDAAERGIVMDHEPVAAAEADASILGAHVTAIADREVEKELQQKSGQAGAENARGKQSAEEHFPQLVGQHGEGLGAAKADPFQKGKQHSAHKTAVTRRHQV